VSDSVLEATQAELAEKMVPWPDDYIEDLSPHAALFLLRQMAMATQKVVLGATISLDGDPDDDAGAIGEIMNGVAAAMAGATHACVALEILPPEAEEALTA
jgi:hypothetical protein